MQKKSILVIDDEKDIRDLLKYNLEKEGYSVLAASTGETGFETAKSKKPDLIVLDWMLPGMDGLEVCRLLKADKALSVIPVLMLTAKNSDTDHVVGFELGAADYLAKPFSVKVLIARIKNIFRQRETKKPASNILSIGVLSIDGERHEFSVNGKPVTLTKLEFNILKFLMANPGIVYSRDQLLSGAWGGEVFVVDRTVDVHIRSIRQKLGKYRDYLETIRGTGYRLTEKKV